MTATDRQSAAELLASAYHSRLRSDVSEARVRLREAEAARGEAERRLLVAEAILRDHDALFRIAAGVQPAADGE